MNDLTLLKLHDASMERIEVYWETGDVALHVDTSEGPVVLKFEGTIGIDIPRKHSWGPSISINEVKDTPELCEIEMQSGDVISIRKMPSKS